MQQSTLGLDLLITGVFLTSAWYFLRVVLQGRRLAHHGFDAPLLANKRSDLVGMLHALIVAVLLILCRAQIPDDTPVPQGLMTVHYVAVAVFVGSYILLRTYYTGERRQGVHRWLTYVSFGSFTVALLTGFARIWLF